MTVGKGRIGREESGMSAVPCEPGRSAILSPRMESVVATGRSASRNGHWQGPSYGNLIFKTALTEVTYRVPLESIEINDGIPTVPGKWPKTMA